MNRLLAGCFDSLVVATSEYGGGAESTRVMELLLEAVEADSSSVDCCCLDLEKIPLIRWEAMVVYEVFVSFGSSGESGSVQSERSVFRLLHNSLDTVTCLKTCSLLLGKTHFGLLGRNFVEKYVGACECK